jgi:hypothetical protein
MEEPADVIVRHQCRELACNRQLDLASILPQFRLDVRKLQGCVELGLRLDRNKLAIPSKPVLGEGRVDIGNS